MFFWFFDFFNFFGALLVCDADQMIQMVDLSKDFENPYQNGEFCSRHAPKVLQKSWKTWKIKKHFFGYYKFYLFMVHKISIPWRQNY